MTNASLTRRSVFSVVAAAIAGGNAPDPAFAAIESHRQAYERFENSDNEAEAYAAEWAAAEALAATVPTSLAGGVALLKYADSHERFSNWTGEPLVTLRNAIGALRA